jgi:hypothetical protein
LYGPLPAFARAVRLSLIDRVGKGARGHRAISSAEAGDIAHPSPTLVRAIDPTGQKLVFARNLLHSEASTGDEGELAAC